MKLEDKTEEENYIKFKNPETEGEIKLFLKED